MLRILMSVFAWILNLTTSIFELFSSTGRFDSDNSLLWALPGIASTLKRVHVRMWICTIEMSTSDLPNWDVKTGCAPLRCQNRICTIEVSKPDLYNWGVKTSSAQLRCQIRICTTEVSKTSSAQWWISQSAKLSRSHLSIHTTTTITTTTLKSVTFVRCLRTHFGVLEHTIAFPCLFPRLFFYNGCGNSQR